MNDPIFNTSNQFESTDKFERSDKRYLPRWNVSSPIIYETERNEEIRQCRSRDLSCSGTCILVHEKLSTEQKITLIIQLSSKVLIRVEGHVVWQRATEEGNLVGINFDNSDEEIQDMILKYAFELQQDSIVKHWFEGWDDSE